jgi:hypothetical protein
LQPHHEHALAVTPSDRAGVFVRDDSHEEKTRDDKKMIRGLSRRAGGSALLRLTLASASVLAVTAAGAAQAAEADAPISTAAAATPAAVSGAQAAAPSGAVTLAQNTTAQTTPTAVTPAATAQDNPYAKLGTNPLMRLWNYEVLEMGKATAPVDPTAPPAPPSVRTGFVPPPQTTPPMPFVDWPYGGTTNLGDNRTASVDSPLMVALAPTGLGKLMQESGIQMYGWVDYGGNISTSKNKYGNAPAGYDYNPNSISLDQAVLYIERTPDTVQTDHVDWGFRVSGIYGVDYRYTTAYGLASYQLLKKNDYMGYDFPMMYGEVYVPQIANGVDIRVGRFISVPDIEAQLAPNNYMYSHSLGYTFDNFTNTGIETTWALTHQFYLSLGVTAGTESTLWQVGEAERNLFPNSPANLAAINKATGLDLTNANPLYSGNKFLKNPGATPSGTMCLRYQSKTGHDDLNVCGDAINGGQWGYNNLQWYGFTYYHQFNQYWHVALEVYNSHQDGVANANNPAVQYIYQNGGTPFSPQYMKYNGPDMAQCKNKEAYTCESEAQSAFAYWNYSPNARNNFTLRTEYFDDMQGQRTGYAAVYYDVGFGLQHWLSPQIELRPEVTWYHASKLAFDDGTKSSETVFSGDAIVHF